jgi:FkbM family methyltransferase
LPANQIKEQGKYNMMENNYGWCLDSIDSNRISTIAEIGSRDGLDAIFLSSHFNSKNCFIFEPDPELGNLIRDNLEKSDESTEKKFFNIALGEESKSVTFKSVDRSKYENLGVGSIFEINFDNRETTDPDYKKESIQKDIQVEMKKYIDLDIDIPDLIAMDVQGAELSVLKGFEGRLKEVYAVILETSISENYIGGSTFLSIYKYMSSQNFSIVINSRNKKNRGLIWEAMKYGILKRKNYIPDINVLFINNN